MIATASAAIDRATEELRTLEGSERRRGVKGLGFRVKGLGFGVWGLGFRVWGLGFSV